MSAFHGGVLVLSLCVSFPWWYTSSVIVCRPSIGGVLVLLFGVDFPWLCTSTVIVSAFHCGVLLLSLSVGFPYVCTNSAIACRLFMLVHLHCYCLLALHGCVRAVLLCVGLPWW